MLTFSILACCSAKETENRKNRASDFFNKKKNDVVNSEYYVSTEVPEHNGRNTRISDFDTNLRVLNKRNPV